MFDVINKHGITIDYENDRMSKLHQSIHIHHKAETHEAGEEFL